MGILSEPLNYMRKLNLPKGFSVCELGDQWVTAETPHYLAVEFYKKIGCGKYISLDGNGRGTHTVDLNAPLAKQIGDLGMFDLVTDFGTGEHVFNQFQVWRTVHELTKQNGFIAFDRPMQGYPGHCYYRTDECLFHDLARANDYRVVTIGTRETSRGVLFRGVWQRTNAEKFRVPQQGRYKSILKI